jgi:hypothetical protein
MLRPLSLALILSIVFGVSVTPAQTGYFPDSTFSTNPNDHFVTDWYSGQLRALQEPSLFALSKNTAAQQYRFLWLRTFHHPVAVRVEVKEDGTGLLTTKITSGAGGYSPGNIITSHVRPMSKEETQRIVSLVTKSDFWNLPSYSREKAGLDGAEWIFEAAVKGNYRVVSDWSPKTGTIHELGSYFLFGLEKIEIPKNEMY